MRKFLILWISQAFSLFGSSVVEFSLAWYLTLKTGSATILATSMLVAMLPTIILGPIIGPFIDRWNRKRIMIISDISISIVTVGLVILFLLNRVEVWHIYVAMVGRAIGQTFHFPAMQAAIPMIVPEKNLSRAAGMNQMLQGAVSIAAPPAGALLIALLPMQWVLAIDIFTAAIAVVCLAPIAIPQPVKAAITAKTSVITEMVQGFHYIWNWKGLALMIALAALISFFLMPAYTLLPMMVNRYLDGEVLKLGWLQTAFGVGIVTGGLILGVWSGFKRKIVTAILGIIVAGAATLALGFIDPDLFLLGLAASLLMGVGLAFGDGPIMAALQSMVSKDIQGRVFALLNSLTSAAVPLGLAVAGPLADSIGVRSIYFIAGPVIILVGAGSFLLPRLMNLEKEGRTSIANQVSKDAVPVPVKIE